MNINHLTLPKDQFTPHFVLFCGIIGDMNIKKKLRMWWLRLDIFAHEHYWPFWVGLFVILRLLVIFLPGPGYSDVTHYYERYANTWHYGLPPYTHAVFEYGPLAAVAIYLPLRVDLAGLGQYYVNYKFLSFLVELPAFIMLVWYQKKRHQSQTFPLLLYLLLTSLAKNWLYEGIDMVFSSLAIMAILVLDLEKKWSRFLSWLLLWASTAVKFLTLPLIAPLYLLTRKKFWPSMVMVLLAFMLIWGGPLAYYRSSLSVPFVYNASRTIKYNTITHLILRTLNNVTHTELQSEEAPDYSFSGPKSDLAGKILTWLYPLSLALILLVQGLYIYCLETGKFIDKPAKMWSQFFQPSPFDSHCRTQIAAWCYLTYFLVSFFTAKIYSNPFLLWLLPLIIVLEWTSQRRQWLFFFLMSIWAILELTPFLTAGFWRLQTYSWFSFYEGFEITYAWIKWGVMLAVVCLVWREAVAKKCSH